jgi:CheY-like chemotaxis protein
MLLADADAKLGERTIEAVRADAGPDVVWCDTGTKLVSVYARLAKAKKPPVLSVLELGLASLDGRATAQTIRAIEKGLGQPPVPILFYTTAPADEDLRGFLSRLGRAVHLQKAADLPPEELAKRLSVAVKRLLAKLGGA